jgi:hypothetical protein
MKKKTLRMIGLLCLACIAAGALVAYRLYNKPHRSVAGETAVALPATRLIDEYEKDEAASNKKYLGKAVQVNGTVSEVSADQQNKQVVLLAGSDMGGVQCSLLEQVPGIKKGDVVTIKGFCTGFLTDVIMDRCIAVH